MYVLLPKPHEHWQNTVLKGASWSYPEYLCAAIRFVFARRHDAKNKDLPRHFVRVHITLLRYQHAKLRRQ